MKKVFERTVNSSVDLPEVMSLCSTVISEAGGEIGYIEIQADTYQAVADILAEYATRLRSL
jgi:hypothetical protein